jgi:preprotein translocase SecE subunit
MFGKIKQFFVEVFVELRKVSWPGSVEVSGSTIVVIVMTLFLVAVIFAWDKILESLLQFVISRPPQG